MAFKMGLTRLCTKVQKGGRTSFKNCSHCDSPGGPKTLQHQVSMPLSGRVQCIDFCIHQIVAALNAGGIRTVASCCGHQKMKGNIVLEDGRTLIIQPTPDSNDAWSQAVTF